MRCAAPLSHCLPPSCFELQMHQPLRVLRKADFVIVNEDTAIKNAAGAITKVLARACSQVLCGGGGDDPAVPG